ncbi:DNA-processing protein DprA [Agromyces allii]|uniref:Smf/DprA SLOG domain-containing protein n=1 Tax=Agromyces allii TaxID=393607 RepID=A0ABP5BTP6_9MICO|nr:DNA-processing protein DprA [Agromyces allii]
MSAVERAERHLRSEFAAVRPDRPARPDRAPDELLGGAAPVAPGAPVSETASEAVAEVDAFARAILGTLAEPGDGTLGRLVAVLGTVRTVDLLLERAPVERFIDAVDAAGEHLTTNDLETALARWTPRIDHPAFVRGLAQAARVDATFIVPGDACWPAGVDDLGAHAPLGLWVRGDPAVLRPAPPAVALVGARAATGYGEHVTMEISAGLADRGVTVVSGGAYGIDGMAHRAALASGGTTIAFLAGGVDRFYPAGHDGLLQRIAETGAVVSELPCGASPTKWRFLQRNPQ